MNRHRILTVAAAFCGGALGSDATHLPWWAGALLGGACGVVAALGVDPAQVGRARQLGAIAGAAGAAAARRAGRGRR